MQALMHRGLPALLAISVVLGAGCAHYPVNPPLEQIDGEKGYRSKNSGTPGSSEELMLILTFSGGGTRASAFSYGILEELERTEVVVSGERRRLLDEVDIISAVSGGSFTAGYFGLYGDRIFEDFESRFLKKNIQSAVLWRLFAPHNWFRFAAPNFDRTDMAAEYYDKQVFEGGTFADISLRKGPYVIINSTDMTLGTYFSFTQDLFDMICSDLSEIKVARAAAASSAVPVLFSPITMRSYAGSCGYEKPGWLEEALEERDVFSRRHHIATKLNRYLDGEKKPYIHLVDGGITDNLGLRVIIDRVIELGDLPKALMEERFEKLKKAVFIVVNAEGGLDPAWDMRENASSLGFDLKVATALPISMYNFETIELVEEELERWQEVFHDRDIESYLIIVSFDALPDQEERQYFRSLKTSLHLDSEDVDSLREVAARLLNDSEEYQRFLRDLDPKAH